MRAGKLRRNLAYQQKTQVPDSLAQPQPTWTTLAQFWCGIRSPTGRESLNAQQIKAQVSHVVETRFSPSTPVLPTGRFVTEDNRVFNISYVLNVDERNRQLDIGCIEVISPPATP
jgi:SPP1 family predicted phage head-tail adaptor